MTNLDRIAKLGRMIWIVKPDQPRIDEMRNQMTFNKRMEFRHAATESHPSSLLFYAYDIHHIIPLSYGGSNKFNNLCLVTKDIHELIHHYIQSMNNPMKPNQRGYVWVPMINKKIFEL